MAASATPRPLRADARRNRARVLEAAEAVFAADGLSAPVEQIARRAGVGIGTVYRHFPTKEVLFEAILVSRFERLAEEANSLSLAGDAGAAFFGLFTRMVEEAAAKKAFADALARAGVDAKAATSAVGQELRRAFGALLARAQQAGAVRDDIDTDQAMAVLAGACLAAEHASWDRDLQAGALAIVFDGLRPAGIR
ncbi:MAG TPA: helix-turn-helix domain-containing protein [Actinomycetes bacterium]|jgi:AcrR family transcriptional regulator|nr:helix-turn-helix domain-containing protein [Actinomycetes bacterium]